MEPELNQLSEGLRAGRSLSQEEAAAAALALAADSVPDAAKKRFLVALALKGETVPEVVGLAQVFRDLALQPDLGPLAEQAIDIVGTGGDHFGGFNISTAAAFVVASLGVPVVKHGNRAITSRSGSSDFLAQVGIAVQPPLPVLRRSLEEIGFCFLFAPAFHPAFKAILPVRKELAAEGMRTVFNILGPLLNPARPPFQVMGVFHQKWVRPLAQALGSLGVRRGLVFHGHLSEGAAGVDEMTSAGDNLCSGIGELDYFQRLVTPESLGLTPCQPEVLKGGTPEENASLLQELLEGRASRGLADTVALNAGAALWVAGRSPALAQGFASARDALGSGLTADWLKRAQRFYAGEPQL